MRAREFAKQGKKFDQQTCKPPDDYEPGGLREKAHAQGQTGDLSHQVQNKRSKLKPYGRSTSSKSRGSQM